MSIKGKGKGALNTVCIFWPRTHVCICAARKLCGRSPVCMLLRFREPPSPFIAKEWRLFTHALQGHSPQIY